VVRELTENQFRCSFAMIAVDTMENVVQHQDREFRTLVMVHPTNGKKKTEPERIDVPLAIQSAGVTYFAVELAR
jgi:hypothetical protein